MKRCLASCVIVAYLSTLSWGVISHTLSVGNTSHPVMYYLVWDMFCGWSGYETRHHLIAEGESGAMYQLTPAPWGEFQPYGPANRADYDSFANHSITIANNVLAHTDHEPIHRIYLVEENWSKRHNRPAHIWNREFEEPYAHHSYYHRRGTYNGAGVPLELKKNWVTSIFEHSVAADTRLANVRKQSRPFFVVSPSRSATPVNQAAPHGLPNQTIQQVGFETPARQ